jgi:hypothetical protein
MKRSTRKKGKGKLHQIKGTIKEKAGNWRMILACKRAAKSKRRPESFKRNWARWRKPSSNGIAGIVRQPVYYLLLINWNEQY